MFKRTLVLFPGFLGQSSDWDLFVESVPKALKSETQFVFMDYFSKQSPLSPLSTWDELNNYIIDKSDSKNIHFVGYSMGGRLALKLYQEKKLSVKSVNLLSAHPGISSLHYAEEHVLGLLLERKNWDNIWADKFLRESSFDESLKEWQSLEVFKEDKPVVRDMIYYSRDKLSLAFKKWSPAQIIISKDHLEGHHWVCGKKDQKYAALYKNMQNSIGGSFDYLEGVGHRTLFYPELWAQALIEKVLASEN